MKLYWTWFKMGLFTFGGGYAMLPLIQKEVVEKHGWATEEEIVTYYTMGQFLPGIIAVNTATLVGYKQRGVLGAILATLGLITPSVILITFLSLGLSSILEVEWVKHSLSGIQIGVAVLMVNTVIKLWNKNIQDKIQFAIFALMIVLLIFGQFEIIWLLLLAVVLGEIAYRIKQRGTVK